MNNSARVARQAAANDDDLALDLCLGPKLNVTQHGHHVAADFAVDIDVAEYRDRRITHGTGCMCIAEDRYDRIVNFARTRG